MKKIYLSGDADTTVTFIDVPVRAFVRMSSGNLFFQPHLGYYYSHLAMGTGGGTEVTDALGTSHSFDPGRCLVSASLSSSSSSSTTLPSSRSSGRSIRARGLVFSRMWRASDGGRFGVSFHASCRIRGEVVNRSNCAVHSSRPVGPMIPAAQVCRREPARKWVSTFVIFLLFRGHKLIPIGMGRFRLKQ